MSLPSGTTYIHYRKREICLVQNDLPGAFYRTPGKKFICLVPYPEEPGKQKHLAKYDLRGVF